MQSEPHWSSFEARMQPGVYRVYWKSGGSSVAAIGMNSDGTKWLAPTNWIAPVLDVSKTPAWDSVEKFELIATQHDPICKTCGHQVAPGVAHDCPGLEPAQAVFTIKIFPDKSHVGVSARDGAPSYLLMRAIAALGMELAELEACPAHAGGVPIEAPPQRAICSVQEMKTSAGSDFYVHIRCGDREITPHKYTIRGRAEYDVSEWDHVLNGTPRRSILDFDTTGKSDIAEPGPTWEYMYLCEDHTWTAWGSRIPEAQRHIEEGHYLAEARRIRK